MIKESMSLISAMMVVLAFFGLASAQVVDEEGLFTSVAPDAMIVLDLSGSMEWNAPGNNDVYSNSNCSGPFYDWSGGSHTTLCSRYAIARRTLFKILDDNNDGQIDSNDTTSLNIRLGLGKFQGSSYEHMRNIGTKYSQIYCGYTTTACTMDGSWNDSNSKNLRYLLRSSVVSGATPLASALNGVKTYLDTNRAADDYRACRQKFVILVSDGADTMSCSGDGSETQSGMYKRRRASVMAAKALADAGYRVFVIGMGSNMPDNLKNNLNWMAYIGGTDNPLVANSGDEAAFDPSSVTECGGDASNDPGALPLSGYAFIANNADDMELAFRQAISMIRESTYSFAQASVASTRMVDENYIYEASFQPLNNEPFWLGHVQKYQIASDGSIGSVVWDAGSILQSTSASSRTIYTTKAGALTAFNTSNITPADLNVADTTRRDEVVGYIRGESTYNKDNWKLGDTFRSNPVTVGTPSPYFRDSIDATQAFNTFRGNNIRSTANGKRIIVCGANDGQVHAFRTDTGVEVWSYIPPNLLSKLKDIAHKSHPTGLTHQYFVDGPITIGDVWLGSGAGTTKVATEWKTLAIFAEGKGGARTLWSSSSSCDSSFSNVYSTTYNQYCGYTALDITNTYSPAFNWHIAPSATQGPYMGEPWSKMKTGRVKIGGNEKWVGFIGGGHSLSTCSGAGCDTRGKGFFVVDLSNGNVLWSYTFADNADMNYALPGNATTLDADRDGFIDTAYIGDLGGNIWRFKFCSYTDGASCATSNWTGSRFFQATSGIGPVYSAPSVSKDANGYLWLHWGTGEKSEPIVIHGRVEKFLAVKDDRTRSVSVSQLEDITNGTYTDNPSKYGWYIQLTGSGEKSLTEATVFAQYVYFTTYTPAAAGGDACNQAGTAKLYAMQYITGSGALGGSARSETIGAGIPTAPIISMNPYGGQNMYNTISDNSAPNKLRDPVAGIANRTNLYFWRDRRLQ